MEPLAKAAKTDKGSAQRHSVVSEEQQNHALQALKEDHLFHIEDATFNIQTGLKAKLKDVKYVLMMGPPCRAEALTKELHTAFGWPVEQVGSEERYALYKVGPCMAVSHGIGMPSMLIMLHEITKALQYAECKDVTYIRIGTSGGIGVKPGTIVVASEGVNGFLESCYEDCILGERKKFPAKFDSQLSEELVAAARRLNVNAELGKTLGTNDFYEGQGRLDGALAPGYSEADKMAWLQRVYDAGVRNMEMEATGLAAFLNRTQIRAGLICTTIIDRLKGDTISVQATPEELKEFSHRAQLVVVEWLRGKV